jgi:hypothetical protein
MDLFKFFRFKKTKPDTNQPAPEMQSEEAKVAADASAPEQSSAELPAALPAAVPAAQVAQPAKKAIAILPYNNLNYFKQVFESVLSQTIYGKHYSEVYDLYVFQDGLQNRHQNTLADYEAIKDLVLAHLPESQFQRQPQNIGTALQFAHVEEQMFARAKEVGPDVNEATDGQGKGYDFCILLEHDFVLAPGYLQTMESLYQRFAKDERIAAISVHSSSYKLPQELQEEHKHTYKVMAHDWGAGVFQRTWQKRLPAMKSYYKLLGNLPFEQRNNLLIQDWMSSMGFVKGSTSQDTIKACVDSGLQTLRLTPFVNQGTYIGVEGMHWNASIYDAAGYGQTLNFEGSYGHAPELSEQDFELLLAMQCQSYLAEPNSFDAKLFEERLLTGKTDIEFAPNALSSNATAEDITAAYKLFLGRFPENLEVVQSRVGVDMPRILRSFMLSEEFLVRQDNWPMVIEAAKRIVELNRIAQSNGQTQTSSQDQTTAPKIAPTPATPPTEPKPQASTPTP